MFFDTHHMLDTSVNDAPRTRRAPSGAPGGSRPDRAPLAPRGVIAIPEDAALVLVGMQRALERPRGVAIDASVSRNNPDAEVAAARLLAEWRATGRPVIHVRHVAPSVTSPLRAGAPTAEFSTLVQPRDPEPVYQKRHGSAFVETTLARDLASRRVRTLVLAGLTIDQSVSSTARSASDLGFTTLVVSDATAAFDRESPDGSRFPAALIHQTALASLHAEIAIVLSSALVLEGVARAAM